MFKNFKLNIAILIALFVGLLVPTIFTTIYLQNKYEKELKKELVLNHKKLLNILSSGLSKPMWEFMHDNAVSLVKPIFENVEILEINVIDVKYNNNVFLHMKKENTPEKIACQDAESILIEQNIVLEKLILGKVTILFSTCRIKEQVLEQKNNLWMIMFFQFFISLGIIFLLMQSKILTPIKKLIRESNLLSKKYLEEEFVWTSSDEIGHLGQSLEHTRLSLIKLFDKEQQTKEEIELLNRNLEEKVKHRTHELMQLNTKLEQTIEDLKTTQEQLIYSEKMASLGNLVAGIAHEINTPIGVGLTGITHFTELSNEINDLYKNRDLSEDEFEEFLSESADLANSINKNLIKAAELIKSFKKIAIDQSSEDKREFNLYEYTNDFIHSMYGTLSKTNIIIEVDINSKININSYPGIYSQFLTILLMNSLLHAYDEKDKGKIKINAYKEDNNKLILCYCDDGKGIQKEDLKFIFDPFFTTKKGTGGSGLGLNILYNIIVGTLKGSVKCESQPGEGAKFIISIPLEV